MNSWMSCKVGMIGAADWPDHLPMVTPPLLVGFPSIKVLESLQSGLNWNLAMNGRSFGWRTAPGTSFGRLGKLWLSTKCLELLRMVMHRRWPPSAVARLKLSSPTANAWLQNNDVGSRTQGRLTPLIFSDWLQQDRTHRARRDQARLSILASDLMGQGRQATHGNPRSPSKDP